MIFVNGISPARFHMTATMSHQLTYNFCFGMISVVRLFIEADFSDGRTNVVLERTGNTQYHSNDSFVWFKYAMHEIDENWHETRGPIMMDSVYNGETYDARAEQIGWDQIGFKNQSWWLPVLVTGGPGGKLLSQSMPGMQTSIVYAVPASVTNPRQGLFVADFGQNFAGSCTLRIRNCISGQKIVLRHAEFLNHTDGYMIQVSVVAHVSRPCTLTLLDPFMNLSLLFHHINIDG
jgi:hypothetical protein